MRKERRQNYSRPFAVLWVAFIGCLAVASFRPGADLFFAIPMVTFGVVVGVDIVYSAITRKPAYRFRRESR